MKNRVFAVGLVMLLIAFSGCTSNFSGKKVGGVTDTTVQNIVCNPPYMRVGDECCLDRDGNGICDRDEVTETTEASEQPTTTESTVAPTVPTTVRATTTTIRAAATTIPPVTTTVATQKHKACVVVETYWKKCMMVDGTGANECSDDFSCMKITNGVCVNGACIAGGVGNTSCELDKDCYRYACLVDKCIRVNATGDDECVGPADQTCWVNAQLKPYHLACVSGTCARVDGPGDNQCDYIGLTTACRHKVCQADNCVEILTPGKSTCTDDQSCAPTHGVCQAGVCVQAPGAGRDECTTNSQCH